MARSGLILVIVLGSAGCAEVSQERIRDYNQDGVHLFQMGNYQAARESFQAAQKLSPEDAALHYNIGECYDRLGSSTRAEQSYTECIQRAPDHADCRHSLTSLLVRTGRRDAAERMVQS